MATLESSAANAACNAVVDQLDGGTIELQTAADAVIATFALGTPAFGDAVDGVATMNAVADDETPVVGGANITKAVVKRADTTTSHTATVGLAGSGADIIATRLSFVEGEPAVLNSYTFAIPLSGS